jgi:hypothetical protein
MFRRTKKSAPRRGSSTHNFRPLGESLESRLNLAGNVFAFALGPNLYIYGDNLANDLRIEGNGVGKVEVQGIATAVNGVANGQLNATGIQNIFMDLGNGDDTTTFVLTEIRGLLRFSGGNGNDNLLFGEGNNGSNTFGSVQAILGAGDDTINVDDDRFTALTSFTSVNGEGNNFIELDPAISTTLGLVTVSGGGGTDFLGIGVGSIGVPGSTSTTGFIKFAAGNGTNTFHLDGTATVNGGITMIGGDGDDIFFPGLNDPQLTVNGSITAMLGNGANLVSFGHDNVDVTGVISVIGGNGVDTVNLSAHDTFDVLAVSLSLGAGNNVVSMNFGATTIHSSLTITTLGGEDKITGSGLDVRGATTVSTGEGADLIQLDNSRFRSVVSVFTAGGNDVVNVEDGNENDGIGTRFDSVVSIDLGLGNDTLNIGFDANDFVTFNRVFANGSLGTDTLLLSVFNAFAFGPTLLSFP